MAMLVSGRVFIVFLAKNELTSNHCFFRTSEAPFFYVFLSNWMNGITHQVTYLNVSQL